MGLAQVDLGLEGNRIDESRSRSCDSKTETATMEANNSKSDSEWNSVDSEK